MKIINKYICEICNEEYDTLIEAMKCEDIGMEKSSFKKGDIVFIKAGYHWYDGDKRWLINPEQYPIKIKPSHGNCMSKCCTLSFYYVITKIDKDPDDRHRLRYHVFTKAMSGKQGHREGHTFVGTHHDLILIKNPPKFVVKDSKNLIGKKSQFLI